MTGNKLSCFNWLDLPTHPLIPPFSPSLPPFLPFANQTYKFDFRRFQYDGKSFRCITRLFIYYWRLFFFCSNFSSSSFVSTKRTPSSTRRDIIAVFYPPTYSPLLPPFLSTSRYGRLIRASKKNTFNFNRPKVDSNWIELDLVRLLLSITWPM